MRTTNKVLVLVAALLAGLTLPAASDAADAPPTPYVPGQLIVGFDGGGESLVRLPDQVGIGEAEQALRSNPDVAYATPNYIARASAVPNDPGRQGTAGGWRWMQWNFLPCGSTCGQSTTPLNFESPGGIDAIDAWRTLRHGGRASGKGVKVAVLDTGVAYRNLKPEFKRSPDFSAKQFLPGHDFVKNNDLPLDRDGHGTHVTGTIAERDNNGVGLTGLAPAAKIIPVRVLNGDGFGTASNIARGIRFAAKSGADVINMSFEFAGSVNSCQKIPTVCKALALATKRYGVVVAAASGNSDGGAVKFPARAPRVIGVGRSTRDGCAAADSRFGSGLDLLAPGGGIPRRGPLGVADCRGDGEPDSSTPIFQLTFSGGNFTDFGFPGFYQGTSMATAHVSGVAAMVISSRVLGKDPSRAQVECQLEGTARNTDVELGQPYDAKLFGAGILDAAAAVEARAPGC